MTFTQTCLIAAERGRVWDFLFDVQNVGRCMPGVEGLTQLDESTYEGKLKLKFGPIALAPTRPSKSSDFCRKMSAGMKRLRQVLRRCTTIFRRIIFDFGLVDEMVNFIVNN